MKIFWASSTVASTGFQHGSPSLTPADRAEDQQQGRQRQSEKESESRILSNRLAKPRDHVMCSVPAPACQAGFSSSLPRLVRIWVSAWTFFIR
jgi:hypothetical protein